MFNKSLVRVFLAVIITITSLFVSTPSIVRAEGSLSYSISIDPNPVVYGHRAISINTRMENNTPDFQVFDISIWVGGQAWGGENYPYFINGGTIYNMVCSTALNGCMFYWRGSLEPRKWYTFSMTTFSGSITGTFDMVKLYVGDNVVASEEISVIEGTGTPYGYMNFMDYVGIFRPVMDEPTALIISVISPVLTQFQATNIKSTCQIDGLPSGFTGHQDRTIEDFTYYVVVHQTLACQITGQVKSIKTGEVFDIVYNILPPYQIFIPIVNN